MNNVLKERGNRYGDFKTQSDISQSLKRIMENTPSWSKLTSWQKESLEMIAIKIGRALNGDPNYKDNWTDIKGYAELVERELS